MQIIVARYNENIDWVLPFSNVIIYNKGEPLDEKYKNHTILSLKNVGREGHTFYNYIYENYDNLPKHIMFLQGYPFDHIPNIIDIIKQLNDVKTISGDFAFLSQHVLKTNLIKCPYHIGHGGIIPLMRVFYELFVYYKSDLEFEFGAGNQFIVSKQHIHRNPREFYLKIVRMLEYENCPIEGYVIERFTGLIFTFQHMGVSYCNERSVAISSFLHQCSLKYNNEKICHIPYNIFDRGMFDPVILHKNENTTTSEKNVIKQEYVMCYHRENSELEKYCIPDCFFHSWPSANIPSFEEIKKEIITASNLEPMYMKVGWVGNIYSPKPDVIEHYTRPLLKSIGDSYPDIFDIVHFMPNNGIIDKNNSGYISIPELVEKYQYLIDIGGNGWSGRLKFLLFSKRPLLIVERVYIEYFYNDLKPYVHYIPVKEDLSDLLQQTLWMINNHDACKEMAERTFNYAMENFTIDKFIDRVFFGYNNILSKSVVEKPIVAKIFV